MGYGEVPIGQIDVQVYPTELGVHSAMPRIMDLCRVGAWADQADLLGNIQIAVTEALNNVAEHGFAGLKPKPVTVSVRVRRDILTVTITDQGHPYPTFRVPRPTAPDLNVPVAEMPEGGFGWTLIHNLTSGLRYTRSTGENRLSLTFSRDPDRE